MKKIGILAMVVVTLLAFGGCGDEKADTAKNEKKVLRVGTEPTFPPFEFHDNKDGDKYVGFDMDIIRAAGKELGYDVEIVSMGFDALIPALDSGSIDVAAAGISMTEERMKKISFTKSYYDSGLTIVVLKDNIEIKDFDDLIGKKIAVQIGTTGSLEANRIKDTTVIEFNGTNEAYLELKNGGVDAVVNDRPVNDFFLKSGGSEFSKAVGTPKNAESYGFATSKKNENLVSELDKAIEVLKKNGEYDKIYEKWFGKKQ